MQDLASCTGFQQAAYLCYIAHNCFAAKSDSLQRQRGEEDPAQSQHMKWLETSALFNAASTECADRLGTSWNLLITAKADLIVSSSAGSDAKLGSCATQPLIAKIVCVSQSQQRCTDCVCLCRQHKLLVEV